MSTDIFEILAGTAHHRKDHHADRGERGPHGRRSRSSRTANKMQIKEAVEKLFNVKVESVRTATFEGKWKRQGKSRGQRSNWKKAFVTLKAGQKPIEFFETT